MSVHKKNIFSFSFFTSKSVNKHSQLGTAPKGETN